MPVRHAQSETRGRPPFGRRGGVGKNGSTRSHNGSGSSAAAIPVHATSSTRIRYCRFCYTLLVLLVAVVSFVPESRRRVLLLEGLHLAGSLRFAYFVLTWIETAWIVAS